MNIQGLRYTLRRLRNAPAFTLAAIAVLALGIGANVAVFTILNGVLLRPLPYRQAGRIVTIKLAGVQPYYAFSYAHILRLRDAVDKQMQIGVTFQSAPASVAGPGGRVQVVQSFVTADTFEMLGVNPILGRSFRPEENDPGRNRIALIGYDVWRALYKSDPKAIGKDLQIKGQPYTVVGVLPESFVFGNSTKMVVWSPATLEPASRSALSGKSARWGFEHFARLPDGMTAQQLAARLTSAQKLIAPEMRNDDPPTRVEVTGYQDFLNQEIRKPLLLLYAVVFAIWALACFNVTSLMLARAISRTREFAVRAALGASRAQLLQLPLVESFLISAAGAVVGLLFGQGIIKLLWRQIDRLVPLASAIHLDWRVLGCLISLTLCTSLIVGTLPALRASSRSAQSGLSGTTSTASVSQSRVRELLVVGQLALTLVFLVGAGLFLRTVYALHHVPLGFRPQNELTGGIILYPNNIEGEWKVDPKVNIIQSGYLPLLDRLRAIPGVQTVALSSVLPMRTEFGVLFDLNIDHSDLPESKQPQIDGRIASDSFVDALGIPMVRGRFFNQDDTTTSLPVAVVNQAFVNKYLPDKNPLGHTLNLGQGRFNDVYIVGVIGDVKQGDVKAPTRPEVYFCLTQVPPATMLYGMSRAFMQVVIRAGVPAMTLRSQFERVIHEVAPDATTIDVETMDQAVEDSFGSQTLIARLLETLAALALMIAVVGLYGLLSFSVAQRTREIGLRMAVGAQQSDIRILVLSRALRLIVVGVSAGIILAWLAVSVAKSYIFGVQTHDVLTFSLVVCVLGASSLFAAWLPARRAAAVDPMRALRAE